MIDRFSVEIYSPTKFEVLKDIVGCRIESNEGIIEMFSNHTGISSSINLGEMVIFKNNEEITFYIYSGSINFDNQMNLLKILCLDFDVTKEIYKSTEEIINLINKESESSFHLQFSEDNKISLEKIK